MAALNPDYSKRDCSLPPGCKDLIDVIRQEEKAKFLDRYRILIYEVARKAGLTDGEAQEVVQDVTMSVAQKTSNLGGIPAKGSFKAWLLHLTQWRISDKVRKRRDGAV